MIKKALLLAAALVSSNSAGAQPGVKVEPAREENSSAKEVTENSMNQEINKTTIIESLQAIRKDPSTVKFSSAMCYEMSNPPVDTTFSCPDCGTVTPYYRESFQGRVSDHLPSLIRSLKDSKVKISVDHSDFCSKCNKVGENKPELKFTTHCLDCGQTFNWNVNTIEGIDQLGLLFVSFPITSIDQGQIGEQLIEPEKLSEYLSQRLLCNTCREKHGLK